jgi:DNA-binding NarL/FixJ family response regulator
LTEAIASPIEQWRSERTLLWRRALRAFEEGTAAYHRAVAIYEATHVLPRRAAIVRPVPRKTASAASPAPKAAATGRVEARSRLTARQREIAALIADGLTNRQIARRLVLTEGTVANHVRAMLIRLGVRSRAQVAVWHVERGR